MEILIKTSELFDPGIIGIDAMETDEGLVVHEVNSRVEFKGASKVYGIVKRPSGTHASDECGTVEIKFFCELEGIVLGIYQIQFYTLRLKFLYYLLFLPGY